MPIPTKYLLSHNGRHCSIVVNCFKMCIFALARTTRVNESVTDVRCELLQNVYLCISTYNWRRQFERCRLVVNCFKMCIFALARTTTIWGSPAYASCELLQNVYLCISTYNLYDIKRVEEFVVNCFKMCIFALARTTDIINRIIYSSCELLQNVYLCISTYN